MVDYLRRKMKTMDGSARYYYVKTMSDGTSVRASKADYEKFKEKKGGPPGPMGMYKDGMEYKKKKMGMW